MSKFHRHHHILRVNHLKQVLNSIASSEIDRGAYQHFSHIHVVKSRLKQIKHVNVSIRLLREYVVQDWLCELIQQELCKQRFAMGLTHRPDNALETRQQAICDIKLDTITNSPHLIGWSYLHHYYIRPDLMISQSDFATLASMSTRNVRRYRDLVLEKLLQCIIEQELQIISLKPTNMNVN